MNSTSTIVVPSETADIGAEAQGTEPPGARDYARFYLDQKWVPVPIASREKGPKTKGWHKRTHDFAKINLPNEFPANAPRNIGVILGRVSGGLVDYDADCPEAIAFAPLFLPETVMFGRASKPRSHYLYISDVVSPIKHTDPETKKATLEIRTNGQQTVFPGSVHPSGEAIEFDPATPDIPSPTRIAAADLEAAAHRIHALCIVARYWPKGGRHEAQMALAGSLLSAGWPEDLVINVLCTVCRLNGDEDRPKREATVRSTAKAIAEGNPVKQWGTLQRSLPPSVWPCVCEALDLAEEADAKDTPAADVPTVRTTTIERAAHLGAPVTHQPTGIEPLDTACRGGLRPGKLVIIGGAPGACKTTLLVQLCVHYATHLPVAIVACDEDADGLLIRAGQVMGGRREALEEGDQAAREELIENLRARKYFEIIDGEDEGSTIEAAAHELAKQGPGILGVDSLQTCRTASKPKDEGPRARADHTVAVLKSIAKQYGHTILVTSELSRGSYRSKASEEQIEDLAAPKESGGIEYAASVLMIMRSVKDCHDMIDVTVAKNRLGGAKPRFKMRLNTGSATLTVEPENSSPFQKTNTKHETKRRILEAVEDCQLPITSANDAYNAVRGTRDVVLNCFGELKDGGEILWKGDRYVVKHPRRSATPVAPVGGQGPTMVEKARAFEKAKGTAVGDLQRAIREGTFPEHMTNGISAAEARHALPNLSTNTVVSAFKEMRWEKRRIANARCYFPPAT